MSSISTKILKLWIAIQITSPFPFPFRIQSSRKKKRHLTPPLPLPSPLVLLDTLEHVLFEYHSVRAANVTRKRSEGNEEECFEVVVKSISQLGHWVIRWMMIRGYLERSPPITVRTTAEKGGRGGREGLEYLSRVTWPRINGREERGTVKFARTVAGRGQIAWKLTRGFPYGDILGFLSSNMCQPDIFVYLFFFFLLIKIGSCWFY